MLLVAYRSTNSWGMLLPLQKCSFLHQWRFLQMYITLPHLNVINSPPRRLFRYRSHWTWARSRSDCCNTTRPEALLLIHRLFISSIQLASEPTQGFLTALSKEGKQIFEHWCSENTVSSCSPHADAHRSHFPSDATVSSHICDLKQLGNVTTNFQN